MSEAISVYIVDHALSMGIIAPLMTFASSDARNAMPRATSSTPMMGTGVPSASFETCICTTGLELSAMNITIKLRCLQERVEACRIELIHLDGRRDICGYSSWQNCVATNTLLVESPRNILCCTNLFVDFSTNSTMLAESLYVRGRACSPYTRCLRWRRTCLLC